MTTITTPTEPVDQNEIRTTQVLVPTLLLTAFVLDRPDIVAILAAVFAISVLLPPLAPFDLLYRWVLRPVGLVKSDWRDDHMAAHRFARAIGLLVIGSAAGLLYAGYTVAGWSLVWLVISLAGMALIGWCAGCFMYYMLNRAGLNRLFRHSTPPGTFPGARPPSAENAA